MQTEQITYQQLVETANDIIFTTDLKGHFTYVNPATIRITGFSESELIGMCFLELIRPDYRDEAMTFFTRQVEEKIQATYFECPIILENKELYWIAQNTQLVFDKEGQPVAFQVVARDITDWKQAEQQLEIQNTALQSAANGITITDEKGKILWVNKAFTQLTQYSPEKVIGKNMNILKSGVHEPAYYQDLWETISSGNVWQGEIVNRRKDGSLYVEEMTITPVKATGKEITHFIAVKQDISERKEKEDQIEKNQKTREALNALLQLALAEDPLQDLLQQALDLLLALPWLKIQEKGSIFLVEGNEDILTLAVEHDLGKPLLTKCARVPFGHCLCGQAAASGSTVFANCVDHNHVIQYKGMPPHGHINVPVMVDDKVVGVLNLYVEEGHKQDAQEIAFLEAAAKTLAALIKRKRVEIALRESEARFRRLADATLEGIIIHENGKIVEINNALAQMMGYDPAQLLGMDILDLVAPAHLETVKSRINSTDEKSYEIEALRQDGSTFPVELVVRVLSQEGKITRFVSVRDITERKQLEAKVHKALKRREREVQLSIQMAQEIAAAADIQELYSRVVSQVQEQFGYYHTQLLRYDAALDSIMLIEGYGEVGRQMKELNHSVPLGVGLIGMAAALSASVLRPDVSQDPTWQGNPLLPDTKGELAVPIKLRDTILGVLDVQSDKAGALDENDQLILEGLCGQIAVAIETTTLREEMEGRLRELDALQRQLSRKGWQAYQAEKVEVEGYKYDHSGVSPILSAPETAVNGSANTNQLTDLPAIEGEIKPLIVRGEKIGALSVEDDLERPLTEDELEFLEAISREVADALEAARLFEQTQDALAVQEKLATELETVAQVSTAASTILDVEALLQAVVDLAKSSFNLYHAHIYLMHESNTRLILKAGAGNIGRLMTLEGREINIYAESLVARAARTREGVIANNVRKTVDYLPHPLLPHTQSELAVPMIVGEKLVGILDLQSDRADFFSEDDLRTQKTLASQIAVAIENAQQYAEQVQTSEKLREVDLLKSEFLASMSHELRTPLNSIIGFADVLLEGLDGELNERMEEDVRLIRNSGDHLRNLIGDILDMSKIESGRMELRYEEIDLRYMADDIMALAAPLAQEKNLRLHLEIDKNVQTITADRTRLRQVLWNIMGNAIKFTEEGSVTLTMQNETDHLLIAIRDTGIGIKEEHIPIVFEQFRQVDGSLNRAAGGTGLGMPITKKLVNLHGGEIWVESVYGQGSTFFFTIPYNPAPVKIQAAEATARV
ncbi:MAG TPA: PAS domain S-box protein [Anaerolineae bacterium]|nr:PAS domain S-box protein [Anaerolineae bacterium]